MVGNARPVGNLGSSEIAANVLHNADDRTRTTIREMTERRADHYFVGNQGETGSKRYGENTYEARDNNVKAKNDNISEVVETHNIQQTNLLMQLNITLN